MIPWMVARELRATLLDYLRSTWGLADRRFEAALFRFLSGPEGMFQGPYLRLGLPFAPAPADVRVPLDIVPPYGPHLHQLQAWQRLSSRDKAPEATLITTGTGSGKTECFLYPLLDHAHRKHAAGQRGIKAIVLYPMNALASDQAARFASAIDGHDALRGRLRVGLFVGGQGRHREMGRDHVVDDNDRLRSDPPDILLTNYRMLDLLLQRPKDAPLWRFNEPETLRYLVLDEIHTYDGAQGTDVACLLRRLAQRLSSAEAICPVGTSATVGAGEATRTELLRFASTLFDQQLVDEAFIGETRLRPEELLAEAPLPERYPDVPGPWPAPGESAEAHVRAAVAAWLPAAAQGEILAGDRFDRVALGRWVLRLPLVRAVLFAAHARPRSLDELTTGLATAPGAELPGYAAAPWDVRQGWLASALSLLSYAERPVAHGTMPLVSVQGTLWVRELRRLLARVGDTPAFRFHDESPPPPDEAWLPRYACRDCGQGGWLLTESGPGDTLGLDYQTVARAFQERSDDLRLLHDDASFEDAHELLRVAWLDARRRRLLDKPGEDTPRVVVVSVRQSKLACPGCGGNDSLRILAARGTTLSSVAVGHLFTTPLNTDKKLLTFSDSVQDAAHRAGFFGARTYRFSLRSAILAAVPQEGTRSLAELGEAAWVEGIATLEAEATETGDGTRPALSATAELTARLLPSDMHWLANVGAWHDALDELVRAQQRAAEDGQPPPRQVPDPSPALVADLKTRLDWECLRELGVASRIGRTLEQSGCVSVTVDASRFAAALDRALAPLQQRLGLATDMGRPAVAACLAGLLTRLRLRGGIDHRLLHPYLQSGGNGFLLSRERAPLLSPFSRDTTRPLFLTNAPKARSFDTVAGTRAGTWHVDWLGRALGMAPEPITARQAYDIILDALVREGILVAHASSESAGAGRKATVWALRPEALTVSRAHVTRRCGRCGHELAAVGASPTDPLEHPCLRFRCAGRYEAIAPSREESDELPAVGYYRRFYERGRLGRLWSHEHTGLLARAARESLELEFKLRPRPDSPNLLSCTPTLEMGIDVGDLSATLLCSVPPTTANYAQRVGRAGRKTGNALVLAFAATKPHDLHFFQQPLEAMAGTIQPPGCYLRAPEVLKRQALAFCFDSFARDGGKLGGQLGDVLKGKGAKPFPQPLFDYLAPKREALRDAFVELFGRDLDLAARAAVAALFEVGPDGRSPLEAGLQKVADGARDRRESLRKLVQDIDARLRALDEEEEAKKADDHEEERARLVDERRFSLHQLVALQKSELWQWLSEESCLPNYAFPERGVRLDAFIRREGAGRDPEHHSWVRAPASALRELAPFNAFYASARRVHVGGVELKRHEPVVNWRFCRSCHHAERDAALVEAEDLCPKCGDQGWADVGQRRRVIALAEVFAVERHRDAVLGDDGEERQRRFYETVHLFEPGSEARDAWASDEEGFGFELQPQMWLRQLNLGPSPRRSNPPRTRLAGSEPHDVAFILCESCGHAQLPPGEQPAGRRSETHRAWCSERRKPVEKQPLRPVHLMRELRTEALRLVIPIADARSVEDDLANLRAALRLGLRRLLGGEPDFLDVYAYDEPLPGREGRRRFLVVLDRVPGGTGMLAELCRDKGAKLKEILELAEHALQHCEHRTREPAVKACYQCLYAYRLGNELPVLDAARAVELVGRLLAGFGALRRVDTIGTMSQSRVLESELEERFVAALADKVRNASGAWERLGDGQWQVTLGERRWRLRAQVELGRDQVEVPCRADFVFFPEDGREARPVAVFTDGLAYHVMPREPVARLGDDARKRRGISSGGTMLSWSLSWKDVVSPMDPPVPRWLGDGTHFGDFQRLVHKLDERREGDRAGDLLLILDGEPLEGLLAYLRAPSRLDELARLAAFSLLSRGRRQPRGRLDETHRSWRTDQDCALLPLVASEGDTVTAQRTFGEHARLLVDLPVARLGGLAVSAEELRVTLRLDDGPEARQAASFEASWRHWLRSWNLLQVLPDAVFTTRSAAAPAVVSEVASPPAPTASDDPRLVAVAEILDEDCAAAVRALLLAHPEIEAPRVPLELRRPHDEVDGDLELGWPGRRVAVYFDAQRSVAEALEAAGWTVLAIERGIDEDVLAQALGLSGGD
ncbi:MAG: DEAD/DEAH box helicase [Polyangiaceae bacterium]